MRRNISGGSKDIDVRPRRFFPRRRRREKMNSVSEQASQEHSHAAETKKDLSHQETSDSSTITALPQSSSSLSDVAILHNTITNTVHLDDNCGTSMQPVNKDSFLMCGLQRRSYTDAFEHLSADPTVEESIECVFEHQLQEGIPMSPMSVEHDDTALEESYYDDDDIQHYDSGKLVFIGSVSPSRGNVLSSDGKDHVQSILKSSICRDTCSSSSCLSCRSQSCDDFITRVPKNDWPLSHLMLRPRPGSGTNIIGVRYANEQVYLKQWWDHNSSTLSSTFCHKCCLPINDGTEAPGRTLVIDFESDIFEGTMQLRIRNAKRLITKANSFEPEIGYFTGLNRHYQCIVRGRFKRPGIPMIHTYSGQLFQKSLKLPASFIVKGGVKIMSFFAPMVQANLGGKRPYVLTPLGSSPQTIHVEELSLSNGNKYKSDSTISEMIQEPIDNSKKLIPLNSGIESCSIVHTKARKKAFDKLCMANDTSLTFRTDKIYTFEFLQHLIDFTTFEVSLGNIIGNHKVGKMMNGQPMNIMSTYKYHEETTGQMKQETIWSFDLWHESILLGQ